MFFFLPLFHQTWWQHSSECMCRLWNIAMRDYQENGTTGQTDPQTDGQTPEKVIPMCRYASQRTQKPTSLQLFFLLPLALWGPGGLSRECVLRIPSVSLKATNWGDVSESPYKEGWSRVGAWTGTLKNPVKSLWRWEPDRRSNYFFSPTAHLCAVTYMTELSLIVTLNSQFNSTQLLPLWNFLLPNLFSSISIVLHSPIFVDSFYKIAMDTSNEKLFTIAWFAISHSWITKVSLTL